MSMYTKDFRRLLRLSVASLSITSLCGLATLANAQQAATSYADAIVLPQYYPGMGRVMVLSGIESARPVKSETISFIQQVASPPNSSDQAKLTIQATVTPDQPNQLKVVVLQQPIVPQPIAQQETVQPNQDSQLQRRTAPVQPQRDQPQLRREQPREVQGVPLNPANRDQPNRNENRGNEERREPARNSDRVGERPGSDRGPDRDAASNGRGPGFGGPGPGLGGLGFNPDLGPWMRGGMDSGPNNGPNNGPGRGGINNGPGHDLDSIDRIFSSPVVRQFLQLKEENLQLKAELKMKERELEMKMEMTEMRLRMHMEEAEKRVHQANQQVAEMRERSGGREQPAARAEAAERAAKADPQRARKEAIEREANELKGDRAAAEAENQGQDLRKSIERLTQERNRLVAELENVLRQSEEMKRKLNAVVQEAVVQEKAKMEKSPGEQQLEKALRSAEQAAKLRKEAQSKMTEAKKTEMKKDEAYKEKTGKRKKGREETERDEAGVGRNNDTVDQEGNK